VNFFLANSFGLGGSGHNGDVFRPIRSASSGSFLPDGTNELKNSNIARDLMRLPKRSFDIITYFWGACSLWGWRRKEPAGEENF
jgi:hypothetical protein